MNRKFTFQGYVTSIPGPWTPYAQHGSDMAIQVLTASVEPRHRRGSEFMPGGRCLLGDGNYAAGPNQGVWCYGEIPDHLTGRQARFSATMGL